MKSLSMLVTALNTLAVSLGLTYSALALDPETLYQRSSPAVVSISIPMANHSVMEVDLLSILKG
ncbi:MAG: hypothetical protein HC936_02065 [Leptolyngbyaceae cyanobacterium SU_3_3]|nr:hypothetical protein [Leptolyngbyaceae cyanobacterium SU_3_3]